MTILAAAQTALGRLMGRRPPAVVSSTGELEVEITDLARAAALDISRAADWQGLTKLCTLTGDGVTEAHALPDDYDRMVASTEVHSGLWRNWYYTRIENLDEWLNVQQFAMVTPGYWLLLGGQMHILPLIPPGETAQFWYVSNAIIRGANGTLKDTITADSDTFLLDENVLALAIIWRWRALKQMDYQEDYNNYEIALSQEMARDKGARTIRSGPTRRLGWGARASYPWPLGS